MAALSPVKFVWLRGQYKLGPNRNYYCKLTFNKSPSAYGIDNYLDSYMFSSFPIGTALYPTKQHVPKHRQIIPWQ
jgi:hypothetical protein